MLDTVQRRLQVNTAGLDPKKKIQTQTCRGAFEHRLTGLV